MEVENVKQFKAQVHEGKQAEDVSKHFSYCPDLSDMCDENFEFWDILNKKVEAKRKLKQKMDLSMHHRNEFWDFLSSSPREPNISRAKTLSHANEVINSSSTIFNEQTPSQQSTSMYDSGIDESKTEVGDTSKINFEMNSSACSETFWDFLKCSSPIDTKVTGEKLFNSQQSVAVNDSGIDSKLNHSRSEISETSTTHTEEFWDFLKRKSPVVTKQSVSDCDFWDFLNSNSPIVEFHDIIQSITNSTSTTPAQTVTGTSSISVCTRSDESPFEMDLSDLDSAIFSSSASVKSYHSSNTEVLSEKKIQTSSHAEMTNSQNLWHEQIPQRKSVSRKVTTNTKLPSTFMRRDCPTKHKSIGEVPKVLETGCLGKSNDPYEIPNSENKKSERYSLSETFGSAGPASNNENEKNIFVNECASYNDALSQEPQMVNEGSVVESSNTLNCIITSVCSLKSARSDESEDEIVIDSPVDSSSRCSLNIDQALHNISQTRKANNTSSQINSSKSINKNNVKLNKSGNKSLENAVIKNKRALNYSPIGCSQFNVTDSVFVNGAQHNSNSLVSVINDAESNKKQKSHQEKNLPEKATAIKALPSNSSHFNNLTQSVPATVSSAALNNTNSNASVPLYLILPSNSNSFQNPNYSHYFLIVNNNPTEPKHIAPEQNYQLAMSKSCSTNVTIPSELQNSSLVSARTTTNIQRDYRPPLISKGSSDAQNLQSISSSKLLKSNVHDHADLLKSSYISNSFTITESTKSIAQSSVKHSSITNATNSSQFKNPVVSQSVKNSQILSNSSAVPVYENIFAINCGVKGNSFAPMNYGAASSKTKEKYPQNQSPWNETLSLKKNNTRMKNLPVKTIKPIKCISLGKNKNAIQQTSIPKKIQYISQSNEPLYSQENNEQIKNTENVLALSNSSSENTMFQSSPRQLSTTTQNVLISQQPDAREVRSVALIDLQNKMTLQENANEMNTVNSNSTSFLVNHYFSPSKDTSLLNNSTAPTENNLRLNTENLMTNAFRNVNSTTQDVTSINMNSELPNRYVQVKLAPSQSNSLTTLQALFPPPISMVPVSVIPHNQKSSQSSVSKVTVVEGTSKEQTTLSKSMPLNSSMTRQRSNNKKTGIKMKKVGRKTVRELLEERKQGASNEFVASSDKPQKEIRVLRPILKLPVDNTQPNVLYDKYKASFPGVNNFVNRILVNNIPTTASNKRPNILVLPSVSNPVKNTIIADMPRNLVLKRDLDFTGHASINEVIPNVREFQDPSISPLKKDEMSSGNYRPRIYDLSELQIGSFKVDDDIEYSYGRFRCKFKVIFSKRQFLYDFPVSRCNRMELKSTELWEQMTRITVPFKNIVSMDLRDRTVQLTINSSPSIRLGRVQARSGIISNAVIYDTSVDNDTTWSDEIRRSFDHKVILRKRHANKLKSFLCQFDQRFITVTDVSINASGVCQNNIPVFEGELSPATLRKSFTKYKKCGLRRLPQWDSPESDDQKSSHEDFLQTNQMCSCRISCRSVRCSCVKAAKSCKIGSSVCLCINCDNPLNILESLGLNIEFSLSDRCLFQNIYQIPKLQNFLQRETKLSCCNSFARVQDCIPGTVLCPNIDCNVQLEFSWCRGIVCYPERNPRNHCSLCGQCCFSNGRHCPICNRCYVFSSKLPNCPTCREKTSTNFTPNYTTQLPGVQQATSMHDAKKQNKTKPEIILLDVSSIAKPSNKAEATVESSKKMLNNEDIAAPLEQHENELNIE